MKSRLSFVSNSSSSSFVIAVKPCSTMKSNKMVFPLSKKILHRMRQARDKGFTKLIYRHYEDRNEAHALKDFLIEMHRAGELYLVGDNQEDCFYVA